MRTRNLIALAVLGWWGMRALRRRRVALPPITRSRPIVDRDVADSWENEGGAVLSPG
jgi:hypothetical protein